MNREHFELLDPLRGFAAITVLVYHVIELTNWHDFPTSLAWFRRGWMGVDIFFVLSGFVITLSARNILANSPSHLQGVETYAKKRIARLVPLHYFTICLYIFLFTDFFQTPDFWSNIAAHLFFVHNWIPEFHRAINAPNWTSAVEMQFYLLLILVIPVVKRQNLKYFILAAIGIAFVWRAWAFHTTPDNTANFTDAVFVKATQLPGLIDFFATGMFLAFFVQTPLFAKIKNSLLFRAALLLSIFALGCLVFAILEARELSWWRIAWTVIFPRSLLSILFGLVLLFLCTFRLSPFWKKLFRPLIYLGTISYGIYLFHWSILLVVKEKGLLPWQTLLVTLAVTLLAAALSWHFFEKPILTRAARKKE